VKPVALGCLRWPRLEESPGASGLVTIPTRGAGPGGANRHTRWPHSSRRAGFHRGRRMCVVSGLPRVWSFNDALLRWLVNPVSYLRCGICWRWPWHVDAKSLGASALHRTLCDRASCFPRGHYHQWMHHLLPHPPARGIRVLLRTVTMKMVVSCGDEAEQPAWNIARRR
jgi:hypothetical protein